MVIWFPRKGWIPLQVWLIFGISAATLMVLQYLLPQVGLASCTGDHTEKAQIMSQTWGMCSKHCDTMGQSRVPAKLNPENFSCFVALRNFAKPCGTLRKGLPLSFLEKRKRLYFSSTCCVCLPLQNIFRKFQ